MHQNQVNRKKLKWSHKLTSADNTHTYYAVPYKQPKHTNQLKSKYAMPYLYIYVHVSSAKQVLCFYVYMFRLNVFNTKLSLKELLAGTKFPWGGKGWRLHLTLHSHHQNDSALRGYKDSCVSVSLTVRGKATRQCSRSTCRIKPEVLLLTSLTPYRQAKLAHHI